MRERRLWWIGRKYPQNNYIGLDIKGARMWKGARTVQDRAANVALSGTLELIQYLLAEKRYQKN
jgi:tRNA (guanine-N7-)-methyltransferase